MSETKNSFKDNNQNIGKISYYNDNSNKFKPATEDIKIKNHENYPSNDKKYNNLEEKSIKESSPKASIILEEKKDNQELRNSTSKKNDDYKLNENSDKISNIVNNANHNAKYNYENFEKIKKDENKNFEIKENNSNFTNT